MEFIGRIRQAKGAKYTATIITIPADIVKEMKLKKGSYYKFSVEAVP